MVQTLLGVEQVYRLPLRALQGFPQSLCKLAFADLPIPHYTTLSRRAQELNVVLPALPSGEPLHLVIKRTGLKLYAEGMAFHRRRPELAAKADQPSSAARANYLFDFLVYGGAPPYGRRRPVQTRSWHLPAGKDGTRGTARSKGKVERPFRTVKEARETVYHFHKPETETQANDWLLR